VPRLWSKRGPKRPGSDDAISAGGLTARFGPADAAYHDAVAERFDASYDAHPTYALWWATTITDLAWAHDYDVPDSPTVLDVGCGSGRLLAAFDTFGFKAYGIDHSAAMAARASRRLPAGRIRLASGDALPFKDDAFDLCTVFGMLHHAIGEGNGMTESTIHEAARVARRVVVVEPNILHPYFFATTYLWHGLQEHVAGYPRVEHERPFGLGTLRALATKAGCRVTRSGRIDACRAYGSWLRLPAPFTSHIYGVLRRCPFNGQWP
jgi:SAM-dependent methyltransferase